MSWEWEVEYWEETGQGWGYISYYTGEWFVVALLKMWEMKRIGKGAIRITWRP